MHTLSTQQCADVYLLWLFIVKFRRNLGTEYTQTVLYPESGYPAQAMAQQPASIFVTLSKADISECGCPGKVMRDFVGEVNLQYILLNTPPKITCVMVPDLLWKGFRWAARHHV